MKPSHRTRVIQSPIERLTEELALAQERELCPFDLAPVTSAALQMLFGDTIAIALMQVCASCDLTDSRVCGFESLRTSGCADEAIDGHRAEI